MFYFQTLKYRLLELCLIVLYPVNCCDEVCTAIICPNFANHVLPLDLISKNDILKRILLIKHHVEQLGIVGLKKRYFLVLIAYGHFIEKLGYDTEEE